MNKECLLIYLGVYKFLSTIFYSFRREGFTLVLQLFLHIVLFHAIINGTAFLIMFLDCSLLSVKIEFDFYILILYTETLLKL